MIRWTLILPWSLQFMLQIEVLVKASFKSDVFCIIVLFVVGGRFIVLSGPNSTEMSCS